MSARKALDISDRDLIPLEECVVRLQNLWKLPTPPYTKRTLQNKISRNEIKRYGPHHKTLVDWLEVMAKELKKNG